MEKSPHGSSEIGHDPSFEERMMTMIGNIMESNEAISAKMDANMEATDKRFNNMEQKISSRQSSRANSPLQLKNRKIRVSIQ